MYNSSFSYFYTAANRENSKYVNWLLPYSWRIFELYLLYFLFFSFLCCIYLTEHISKTTVLLNELAEKKIWGSVKIKKNPRIRQFRIPWNSAELKSLQRKILSSVECQKVTSINNRENTYMDKEGNRKMVQRGVIIFEVWTIMSSEQYQFYPAHPSYPNPRTRWFWSTYPQRLYSHWTAV